MNSAKPHKMDVPTSNTPLTVTVEKTIQEVPYHPIKIGAALTVNTSLEGAAGAVSVLSEMLQAAVDTVFAQRRSAHCPYGHAFGTDYDGDTCCDDCPKETYDACQKASKPHQK